MSIIFMAGKLTHKAKYLLKHLFSRIFNMFSSCIAVRHHANVRQSRYNTDTILKCMAIFRLLGN